MRVIHVKFDLPYNWGSLRKYGLHFDRLPKQTIMTGQYRQFEVDNESMALCVKMDFYKSQVIIPKGDNDLYITISMKGESSIEWVLNSFTRKALQLKLVSCKEFDEFESNYSKTLKPIAGIDHISFVLSAGAIAYVVYTMFRAEVIDDEKATLIWVTTIIGALTLSILWKDRKKIAKAAYKSRMILLNALLFIIILVLSIQGFLTLGWIIVLVPIVVITRTIMFENDRLNKVAGY